MKTYYIYMLVNPKNGQPFYIGCSINPYNRQFGHRAKACRRTKSFLLACPPKIAYITLHNIVPKLEVIDEIICSNKKEAELVEEYWIHQFQTWGFGLVNMRSNFTTGNYCSNKKTVFDRIFKSKTAA